MRSFFWRNTLKNLCRFSLPRKDNAYSHLRTCIMGDWSYFTTWYAQTMLGIFLISLRFEEFLMALVAILVSVPSLLMKMLCSMQTSCLCVYHEP